MNESFKTIGRHPFNSRQVKKRVYTSRADYDKYKDDLTKRYEQYLNVEHYELINGIWERLINEDRLYVGGCTWRPGYEY